MARDLTGTMTGVDSDSPARGHSRRMSMTMWTMPTNRRFGKHRLLGTTLCRPGLSLPYAGPEALPPSRRFPLQAVPAGERPDPQEGSPDEILQRNGTEPAAVLAVVPVVTHYPDMAGRHVEGRYIPHPVAGG